MLNFRFSQLTLSIIMTAIIGINHTHAMLPNPLTTPNLATPANQDLSMSVAITAFLVQQDALGKETLTPITPDTKLNVGDVLEYHGYFTNQTGMRLRKANISLEIPQNLAFIGFATPSNPQASVDGIRFLRTPLQTKVNGQMQNIAFHHYQGLRWQIEDIGINGTAIVKYRAHLK